jgi:hypothetical protein
MVTAVETAPRQKFSAPQITGGASLAGKGANNIVPITASRYKLPAQRLPEAIFKTIANPEQAKLNLFSRIALPLPFILGPLLIGGLTCRTTVNSQIQLHQEVNPFFRFLRDIYPRVYEIMIGTGIVTGIATASLPRIIAYTLGLLSAFYLESKEKQGNLALDKKTEAEASADKDAKTIAYWKEQLAASNAGIAAFSRLFYCAFMWLTFAPLTAEQSNLKDMHGNKLFELKKPTSLDPKTFWQEFKTNLMPNCKKEVQAGLYYSNIFNFAGIKEGFQTLIGQNAAFEANLTKQGIPKTFVKRFSHRLGTDKVAPWITMLLNANLRLVTVILTAVSCFALGGIKCFNNDNPALADKEHLEIAKQKPFFTKMFDISMLLNNLGMLFMGLCSFASGCSDKYRMMAGEIAGVCQTLTGFFYSTAAVLDQFHLYILAQAVKIFANIFAQAANTLSAANKAVPELVNAGIMKNLEPLPA